MNIGILHLLTISILFIINTNQDPKAPFWPETFQQDFIQSDSKLNITAAGRLWYDIKNNRQRTDIQADYYDALCQSVAQSIFTNCSQIIVNDALYVWLPNQNKCCKCCTAEQGCAVQPRDWLRDFDYVGEVDINGQSYFKWSNSGQNYIATKDNQHIPRRIEAQSYGVDFLINTYLTDPISDSVFQLPNSSCNSNCPKETMCGNSAKLSALSRNKISKEKRQKSKILAQQGTEIER